MEVRPRWRAASSVMDSFRHTARSRTRRAAVGRGKAGSSEIFCMNFSPGDAGRGLDSFWPVPAVGFQPSEGGSGIFVLTSPRGIQVPYYYYFCVDIDCRAAGRTDDSSTIRDFFTRTERGGLGTDQYRGRASVIPHSVEPVPNASRRGLRTRSTAPYGGGPIRSRRVVRVRNMRAVSAGRKTVRKTPVSVAPHARRVFIYHHNTRDTSTHYSRSRVATQRPMSAVLNNNVAPTIMIFTIVSRRCSFVVRPIPCNVKVISSIRGPKGV